MKYRKLKTIHDAYKFFKKTDSPLLYKIRKELDSLFFIVTRGKKEALELEQGIKAEINHHNNKDYYNDDTITLKKMNDDGMVSNRLYNCLAKCKFVYLREVIYYYQKTNDINDFLQIKGFGKTCLNELNELLYNAKNIVSLCEDDVFENFELDGIKIGANNNSEFLDSFYERYKLICGNALYVRDINLFYNELKIKSSGRVRNFLNENIPTVDDALRFYFEKNKVLYDYGKCGKRSIDEINNIIFSLYNYICELYSVDVNIHLKNFFKRDYPFLSNNDIDFIFLYYIDNLCLPMFFILHKCLITSSNRFERVFCKYNGIGCDSATMRSIAKIYDVSVETIRNILHSKDIEYPQIIISKEWSRYSILNQIVYKNNNEFEEIVKKEKLNISFSEFMSLCSLVREIETFDINDKKCYVSKTLLDSFDLKNSIKDIRNAIIQKRTENESVSINVFIDTYVIKTPQFDAMIIYNLIKEILHNNYGLDMVGNKVIIGKNCLDRKIEIFNIIKENNAPMHINDIRLELISKYSEFTDVTLMQIRSDIQRHPNIKSIGKKSTYIIDSWNVYTGTIGDLLYEVLNNNDVPMGIKDLYDIIVMRYPSTTEKSISSLLSMDDKFVRYDGNLYGIEGKPYSDDFKVCTIIRHRMPFEARCEEYENFIISHHHSPQANGTEEEQSLLRWYNNVMSGRISITETQSITFNNMIKKYEDYIMSGEEYNYYRYSKEFELFIEENYVFPSKNVEDEKRLYKWFYRELGRYKSYPDKRKFFFETLIETLEEYGFVFG